jgi:hypothetical protein
MRFLRRVKMTGVTPKPRATRYQRDFAFRWKTRDPSQKNAQDFGRRLPRAKNARSRLLSASSEAPQGMCGIRGRGRPRHTLSAYMKASLGNQIGLFLLRLGGGEKRERPIAHRFRSSFTVFFNEGGIKIVAQLATARQRTPSGFCSWAR